MASRRLLLPAPRPVFHKVAAMTRHTVIIAMVFSRPRRSSLFSNPTPTAIAPSAASQMPRVKLSSKLATVGTSKTQIQKHEDGIEIDRAGKRLAGSDALQHGKALAGVRADCATQLPYRGKQGGGKRTDQKTPQGLLVHHQTGHQDEYKSELFNLEQI